MQNGRLLKSIQLKQLTVEVYIGNIVMSFSLRIILVFLHKHWILFREGVVDSSEQVRLSYGFSSHINIQVIAGFFEFLKLLAGLYVLLVKQYRQYGLSCTGVVDSLLAENQSRSIINWLSLVLSFLTAFEQENKSKHFLIL